MIKTNSYLSKLYKNDDVIDIYKSLFLIALPIFIELFASGLISFFSTLIASNISNTAISVIGIVDPIYSIFIEAMGAFAIGGGVAIAQAYGRKDKYAVNRITIQAIAASVLITIVISAVLWIFRVPLLHMLYRQADPALINMSAEYIGIIALSFPFLAANQMSLYLYRGIGQTKIPMIIVILICVINLPIRFLLMRGLEWRFIHIKAMGARGCAVAILLEEIVAFIIIALFLVSKKTHLRLYFRKGFKPDWPILKGILYIGIPAMLEQTIFTAGKLTAQMFIVGLGTAVIAANSIIQSIINIITVPGMAITYSIPHLAGKAIGEGDFKRARKVMSAMLGLTVSLYGVLGTLLLIFRHSVISVYTKDAATAGVLNAPVIFTAIAIGMVWSLSYLVPYGLRAAGDVRFTISISVIGTWVFHVLLGFVLVKAGFGIIGIWIAYFLNWLFRAIASGVRFKGGRWKIRRF